MGIWQRTGGHLRGPWYAAQNITECLNHDASYQFVKISISSTGDVITFNYFNGHTVEEVTEEKYEACEVSILQFFFGFSQGIVK